MESWEGLKTFFFKWKKDPELGDRVNFVSQVDEDLGTDSEIFTITSDKPDLETRRRADSECGSETSNNEAFTLNEALEFIGYGKFQRKLAVLCGLAWLADAMETMTLSILGPQLHCEWRLENTMVALITSVVFIGMGLSSYFWGHLSDKYGRRKGLIICISWTLYFSILSGFAPGYGWILALRGLVGVGIGGAHQAVTLFAEFLPLKARGMSIMTMAVFWAIGGVFEVLLALLVMPTLGWRWLVVLSAIPLAIFICFSFWLPESPRFNVVAGNIEKAMATLRYVAKDNGKSMPPGRILNNYQNSHETIKELFTPQNRRTTLLLLFLWFTSAFTYYGIILLTTGIFQSNVCKLMEGTKTEMRCSLECRYLTAADYRDLLWTSLAEFPGLFVFMLLVDRIGRKKSMALGFFLFGLCLLPLYACIPRAAVTVFLFLARAVVAGGFQVCFIYTPEVFPTEIRALALGTCSGVSRIGALITPFVAQVLLKISLELTISLYLALSLLSGAAALMLPIETSGRKMQETTADKNQ